LLWLSVVVIKPEWLMLEVAMRLPAYSVGGRNDSLALGRRNYGLLSLREIEQVSDRDFSQISFCSEKIAEDTGREGSGFPNIKQSHHFVPSFHLYRFSQRQRIRLNT
jgi:hypothetical protein